MGRPWREEYKWSSDIFYRKNLNGFISTNVILDTLDKDREEAIKKYRINARKGRSRL